MSNMYGKDKFHDRQKAVLQKSAQKIENDSGWSQDNFLRGYAEEILPASGAELSFGELCAIGEQVEQETAFSAKEAMRNKIKARRDGRLQIKDNIHDIGKGYEKSTDDRGHAIADRFDGANDLENLVPQDAGLNRNEFKNFESKLAQELEAGKQVYLKLEMHYPGDSFRPDAITAETTIDGKQEVKVFLNDKY